jgi:hypothetical protein
MQPTTLCSLSQQQDEGGVVFHSIGLVDKINIRCYLAGTIQHFRNGGRPPQDVSARTVFQTGGVPRIFIFMKTD